MASATQLDNVLSYRGTVQRGEQLWYKLGSEGDERALVEVWGRTSSCPVRVALLDAHGGMLGEIISSTAEILPFSVAFPAHPISSVYYLRVDADPYSACGSAGYVLKLDAPVEPGLCEALNGPGTPACYAPEPITTAAPKLDVRACDNALAVLRRATVAIESERALVRRHRASIRALRGAEAGRLSARRRERAICGY